MAVLKEIWNEWKLDKPFKRDSNSSIKLSLIAMILTINKSLEPLSKFQACSWIQKTWLPMMYNFSPEQINPSRVFRELGYIEDCKKDICNHLYKSLKSRFPASMNNVYYDLSSTTFSGAKCILIKWGHCKEGYLNHVVLALLVNQDGLPFYWEVLEGNTADSKTIVWLLDNLKRLFPKLNTTLVFDRGMVSDNNLFKVEESEYKYITAMDKNQIKKITNIDFKKYSFFEINKVEKQITKLKEFTKINDTTSLSGNRNYQ
ncbi:MAG: IS1634 family transposase [Candidatus Cloacimonetes bacterium]|nr:IS1634 family transposase [Candidatus Cloacimonadota bacterium]